MGMIEYWELGIVGIEDERFLGRGIDDSDI